MAQDYDKQDYGECNTCGAPRVKNPKTGKIFCSDKCWLKTPPRAPQAPRTNEAYTGGQRYQIEPKIDLEAKINELTRELNLAKFAIHALWAVLIQGDPDKEKSYELNKIPLVARSKVEPEPEEEAKLDLPF